MKTEFSINISVTIGVTPELLAAIGRLSRGGETYTPPEVVEEATGPEPDEPESVTQDVPDAQADAATRQYTELDVREAIHRVRQRIEGEDYKENPDGELCKKYHRPLTAWFKRVAETIGGVDRPSALPPEKREAFISESEKTVILEDGTIGLKPLF